MANVNNSITFEGTNYNLEEKDRVAAQLALQGSEKGAHFKTIAASTLGGTDVIIGKLGSDDNTADPYTESSTQLFPLGTQLIYGERKYRYAQAGGVALTPGTLQQQKAAVGADHLDLANTGNAATAAGTYEVSLETAGTDITANQYAEGYLWINDATGEGQSMKIKSHPAHDHSEDATIVFTLYDPLTTTLGTTQASVMENPYKATVIAPHTETGDIVGVAPRAVQASYYYWVQTSGPCAVLVDGTVVIGNVVVRNLASHNGSVCIEVAGGSSLDVNPAVGRVLSASADTEYALINLTIE